ncbi:MAG TPA: hypothetical protein VIK14_02300 [Ignavibacteria bacterium]
MWRGEKASEYKTYKARKKNDSTNTYSVKPPVGTFVLRKKDEHYPFTEVELEVIANKPSKVLY